MVPFACWQNRVNWRNIASLTSVQHRRASLALSCLSGCFIKPQWLVVNLGEQIGMLRSVETTG